MSVPPCSNADPFATAVVQLSTLRDFLRFAVTRFDKAGVFFGHGNASAWDEAVYLCQRTLGESLVASELSLDAFDSVTHGQLGSDVMQARAPRRMRRTSRR